MTEQVPQVPLEAPDPGLIDEIFSKAAEELTDSDIDFIVAEFRSDRLSYLQAAEEGKPTKAARTKTDKSKAKANAAQISLDELFG